MPAVAVNDMFDQTKAQASAANRAAAARNRRGRSVRSGAADVRGRCRRPCQPRQRLSIAPDRDGASLTLTGVPARPYFIALVIMLLASCRNWPGIADHWRHIGSDVEYDVAATLFLAVTQLVDGFDDDIGKIDGRLRRIIFFRLDPATATSGREPAPASGRFPSP